MFNTSQLGSVRFGSFQLSLVPFLNQNSFENGWKGYDYFSFGYLNFAHQMLSKSVHKKKLSTKS